MRRIRLLFYPHNLGPNVYHESETVTKYEIMDGAPVRGIASFYVNFLFFCDGTRSLLSYLRIISSSHYKGESIPIRLFLSGFELTPTLKDVAKKFSVRYYLNLVLIDEDVRQLFIQ